MVSNVPGCFILASNFDPLRPERVAFCTIAILFVEPGARLRFSPFEQHLCCSLGERPVIWWRKIDCKRQGPFLPTIFALFIDNIINCVHAGHDSLSNFLYNGVFLHGWNAPLQEWACLPLTSVNALDT